MAEILKEWLSERLKRPVEWESEAFGEVMKDGVMVAEVLQSYSVLNQDQLFLIEPSPDVLVHKTNWKYLSTWLKDININLSDIDIHNIVDGKSSVILRLFYQLFLHLDKRDRINFLKRERNKVSNLLDKIENRFQVEKVKEPESLFVDELSKPLLDERHFIEWQKKKCDEIKKTHEYVRYKYMKMFEKAEDAKGLSYKAPKPQKMASKDKQAINKFLLDHPCYKTYTYEELMDLEAKSVARQNSLAESDWVKNYMEHLHSKIDNTTDSEEFRKQLQSGMVDTVWSTTVADEEAKFDSDLAKKVMKLSQFEKEMCTQIMETKQQARNIVANRVQADLEFADQRKQQFTLYYDNIKQQIAAEITEIDFERDRQEMMHKRKYEEKVKRKRQHHYEICYETMLSILDFATKVAYSKRLLEGDYPADFYIHQWKSLYFKMQPIFEILEPVEDILPEDEAIEEEAPIEEEEIVRLELDRQEALNDTEFLEYHYYLHPWTLEQLVPNFQPDAEERRVEFLGNRIMGHVIYTLLDVKYPFPRAREPADLPRFTCKAILRGLPDKSITTALQTLLNFKKIHVTRLEAAINYCLKCFKTEMVGCTDVELSYDKFHLMATDDDTKELIRSMKVEDDIERARQSTPLVASAKQTSQSAYTMPPNTKQVQTPKTIPEEDIQLSTPAELGQYAYQSLSFGDTLTDHLIAAMLVEYLKDQIDINGFVIINYPNSYREAQILEEVFSGRAPPDEEELLKDSDDIYLESAIAKHRKIEVDPYKDLRSSKLFDDPHKNPEEKPFESYFTTYISMTETIDILQEEMIWYLNPENSSLIDRFYAILGLNYSMYYEQIDKDVLELMCRYIIGEIVVPPKTCDSLYGLRVFSELEFNNPIDKRQKSRILKPTLSGLKKSSSKLKRSTQSVKAPSSEDTLSKFTDKSHSKVMDEHEREKESFLILDPSEEEDLARSKEEEQSIVVEEKIEPGDPEWEYGVLPISETLGEALATCWEAVESTYINDMKQLFLAKRLQMNSVIPYTRFLRDKMEQIITLPSPKQDLVVDFQKEYNNFENDWRDYTLSKNEWHCRIRELRQKLYDICDNRKRFAEQQRQALIVENWAIDELTTMANTYISCMQSEVNRFTMSMQAMHDFYYTLIKQLPPIDRLSPKELSKIPKEYNEGTDRKIDDKLYKMLKNAYCDLQLKNINIDYSNNPFNMVIESNVKLAQKIIRDTNDSYKSLIAREAAEVAKLPIPVKKKDEISEEDIMSPEEKIKIAATKCVEEWMMGSNGEMNRACLRMLVLQGKCYQEMRLFNDQITKAFRDIQVSINTYYAKEILAVDRLCKYWQMAVEESKMIPESLILEKDTFYIDPNLILFENVPPSDDSSKVEDKVSFNEFRVGQLARLREQFIICAPSGIILHKSLIYVLQDFIVFSKETCKGPIIPNAWRCADPDKVPKLIYHVYGESIWIDWREFLIYCTNLRFPTVEELLELRQRYRCKDAASTELIHRENYLNVPLWFEDSFDPDDPCAQLRKLLLYHFLFELYEVSQDMMNYSAFLLACCKSTDPREGFAMALSLAVGQKTCFRFEECEEVICKLIEDKKYRDACRACAHKCAAKFIDTLITKVVDYCAGTTIENLASEPDSSTKPQGKKGKGDGKGKTSFNTTSARDPPKSKTDTQSVSQSVSQSAPHVRTSTYICPPCAVMEMVEIVEEEMEPEKVSLKPDVALTYTVSQSVIWNILHICLPWHFRTNEDTSYKTAIAAVLKRLESDTETGDIYVAKFLADPYVCKLLHTVNKFTVVNIIDAAPEMLMT